MYVQLQAGGAVMGNRRAAGVAVPGASAVGTRGLGYVVPAGGAATKGVMMAGPWGAAIAGALIAAQLFWGAARRRAAQKVAATQIADEAEGMLRDNLNRYLALEAPTADQQRDALMVADYSLDQLQQLCSNPELGSAGERCISERLVRGGSAPWCPTSTGCDWLTLYRDPILAHAPVETMSVWGFDQSGGALSSIFSGSSFLLLAAIALMLVGVAS